MSRFIYRVKDVFGFYGKIPPECVLKYGDIKYMSWLPELSKGYVIRASESGKAYFKAFMYAYPFSDNCDLVGYTSNDVLRFHIYKCNASGYVPPIRNLLLAVKHIYSACINYWAGKHDVESLKMAVVDMIRIERYLGIQPDDYSLTIFTLLGLRHVITGLILREEAWGLGGCGDYANYDYYDDDAYDEDEARIIDEARKIVDYCMDVLLGMLRIGTSRRLYEIVPEN